MVMISHRSPQSPRREPRRRQMIIINEPGIKIKLEKVATTAEAHQADSRDAMNPMNHSTEQGPRRATIEKALAIRAIMGHTNHLGTRVAGVEKAGDFSQGMAEVELPVTSHTLAVEEVLAELAMDQAHQVCFQAMKEQRVDPRTSIEVSAIFIPF